MAAAHWARINRIPMLGICLGLQCAVIEFARNVLGKADANSVEINKDTPHPVVVDMPEHNQGNLGGTMRLGKRTTNFNTQDSILRKLYGDKVRPRRSDFCPLFFQTVNDKPGSLF